MSEGSGKYIWNNFSPDPPHFIYMDMFSIIKSLEIFNPVLD